jgi:hypothetical protein
VSATDSESESGGGSRSENGSASMNGSGNLKRNGIWWLSVVEMRRGEIIRQQIMHITQLVVT